MKIHHLGLVVSDVAEALDALGLPQDSVSESVFDPVQGNMLHFVHIPANDLWLELVQPTTDSSTTRRFAAKHGLGLHHIGFATEDLSATEGLYSARTATFALGRYGISVNSFGGRIRTLFFAVRGLIVEFVAAHD
jgi:catechol 2,3-dioxygenase-like lactoylglutathione lyase family enzyme